MYYPLIGERVWVRDCPDEYIVERTDYSAFVATIALIWDRATVLNRISFRLLFAHSEFEAAQSGVAALFRVREVLRSSKLCIHQGRCETKDMREAIQSTYVTIRQTQVAISRSDLNIARWTDFGYCAIKKA